MLTNKQRLLLSEIRQNSRQRFSDIAARHSIPKSTLSDNYKTVSKCIKKSTILIDFEKLGYSLRMNFVFRMKNNEIIEFLDRQKNVNSIYRINNRHTLFVECFFRSMKEAYELKEIIQEKGVKKVGMIHVIEEIKKEKFLASSEN
ncbi:Lrp/AsnC family transcriptional regulator [Candidatus Woesearchaeota archaeon]|nr:Lrp/AsnC family transcriptional regulator [Candidatus Woesearchaeota archaeon]